MNYILKHTDTPLIRFHASEDSNDPEITILWINEGECCLFPLDLRESYDESLGRWLKRRVICSNI